VNTNANNKIRRIGHLPPSAKLVYKVLENGSLLTQKDLIRETSLPSRTVRYALNRLKEENFLIERHYFIDARQSLYGLNLPQGEGVAV
jgi:transcription initiation factor IIE alpha subunit